MSSTNKMSIVMAAMLIGFLSLGAILLPQAGDVAPPVSGPPTGAAPMAPSFAEEFTGDALDTGRWSLAFYDRSKEQPTVAKRNLWSNRERQIYFDAAFLGLGIDPMRVANGLLTIEAKPLSVEARTAVLTAVAQQPSKIATSSLCEVSYSSGAISTRGRFQQTFGYFEMRARWSAGKGVWPAFWLLPSHGGWPPEIDILEAHGDKPATAFLSIHSKVAGDDTTPVALPRRGTGQDFHTYGMLWTPQTIDFYIDGVKMVSKPTPADMHGPMYILANLAMGGKWPGDPDASTPNPALMQIDYIRAWKFRATP